MKFSVRVRDELASLPIKNSCCRKAFLYGLLLRATEDTNTKDALTLTLPSDREATCDLPSLAATWFRQAWGREVCVRSVTRGAHRYGCLTFTSRHAMGVMHHLMALTPQELETPTEAEGKAPEGVPHVFSRILDFRCSACACSFLRGAFLSAGTVNQPEKNFHLEYRLPPDGRAEAVMTLWQTAGFTPGITRPQASVAQGDGEKGMCRCFFKSAQSLQDVLTYLGAVQAVFDIINIQLTHDVARQENRATNWEAANIGRSVASRGRYMAAIQDLAARQCLDHLPSELYETAQLRVLYPELSLSELAERHDPPITKSGLHHRLEKILSFWEKCRE